ncbi:oligosaccharyl transferase glycoprotein complex, beta subunit, partial [Spiromyces aspiralis]
SFGKRLGLAEFIRFTNDGGNMLVAADERMSDFHASLAKQFGIDFGSQGNARSRVVDHRYYNHLGSADHAVVAVPIDPTRHPAIIGPAGGGDNGDSGVVLFSGAGHSYDPNRPSLFAVLVGRPTTYIRQDPASPLLAGGRLALASVHQARNNARTGFVGSTKLFTDELVNQNVSIPVSDTSSKPARLGKSANSAFIDELLRWVFQEKSVLKITNVVHRKQGGAEQPNHYIERDRMHYQVDISEYDGDRWRPFEANDVQFEAIMLDPYIRVTLNRTATASPASMGYAGDIHLPDKTGTFTFLTQYNRPGYTFIEDRRIVPIHQLRHDEHARFLSAAYPYYTSSLSSALGFVALCVLFLYYRDPSDSVAVAKRHAATGGDPGKSHASNSGSGAVATGSANTAPKYNKAKKKN